MKIDFIFFIKNLHLNSGFVFSNVLVDNCGGLNANSFSNKINEFVKEFYPNSKIFSDSDLLELNKQCQELIPCSYIKITDEQIEGTFEEICNKIQTKYNLCTIVNLLSLDFKNQAEPFCMLLINNESGLCQIGLTGEATRGVRSKIILGPQVQYSAEEIKMLSSDKKFLLYLALYNSAQKEDDPKIRTYKNWILLETMSDGFGKYAKDSVRNLSVKLKVGRINLTVEGYYDIYDYAYKIRNDMVHNGDTNRDLTDVTQVDELAVQFLKMYRSKIINS